MKLVSELSVADAREFELPEIEVWLVLDVPIELPEVEVKNVLYLPAVVDTDVEDSAVEVKAALAL